MVQKVQRVQRVQMAQVGFVPWLYPSCTPPEFTIELGGSVGLRPKWGVCERCAT